MTSQPELKMVTFTGPATVENGHVLNVTFETCKFVDEPTKSLSSSWPPSIAKTAKEVIEKVYPVGTRVVVLDGANISAQIGSERGCCWSAAKKSNVGKIFNVHRVYDDGDLGLTSSCGEFFWSPDFVRKATASDEDRQPELKTGDLVVCDKPFASVPGCSWTQSMNDLIGRVGKVSSTYRGITVDFCNSCALFPASSLRRISGQEAAARRMLDTVLDAFPAEITADSADTIAALVKSSLGKRARKD